MRPRTLAQHAMRRQESTASARNKGRRYTGKGLDSSATISPSHGQHKASTSSGPNAQHATIGAHSRRYVRRDVISAEVADQIASIPRCAMDECDWTEIIDGLCAKHFSWGRRGSWATGGKNA